jgi:hypothetical protein
MTSTREAPSTTWLAVITVELDPVEEYMKPEPEAAPFGNADTM